MSPPNDPRDSGRKTPRGEKLAAALRRNLARRKAAGRLRPATEEGKAPDTSGPDSPAAGAPRRD